MQARVVLEAIAGPLQGKRFTFETHDTFVFGRSRDCHAHLASEDKFASRHHFLLELNPPEACLRDLGSLNGTIVNGKKYGGRRGSETPDEAAARGSAQVWLKDRDEIRVGETVFVVTISSAAEDTKMLQCPECGVELPYETSFRQGQSVCKNCRQTAVTNIAEAAAPAFATEATALREEPTGDIEAYRMIRVLGEGGMGSVHLAERKRDGLAVAVKIMLPKVAVDEHSRKMFLREIEVTRQLSHSNIVELLDYGASGSAFFFVMSLCEGGSLQDLLERNGGPLSAGQALPPVLQVLDALAFAHARGFVHRDIKPQNILLTSEGREQTARLADFGLAKNFELAGFSGMTATGVAGGTPFFMPREQLLQYRYVNPLSDLWSIAATLYYLLTGKSPRHFAPGRDPIEVILRGGSVPLKQHQLNLPDPFCFVLDKALNDDPALRYQNAAELNEALQVASATPSE